MRKHKGKLLDTIMMIMMTRIMVLIMTFCVCILHDSYAESVGATHFLTSAKQNKGLEECFVDLTQSKYPLIRNQPVCAT